MSVLRMLSIELTGQPLENRLSTVSAGLSLTSIIFMIFTSQVALYFRNTPLHSRDSLWIKGLVISIWMLQALEFNDFALSMKLVKEWLWEQAVYIATCVTTECLVHVYFISRIYILETNQGHLISIMLCIISVLEGGEDLRPYTTQLTSYTDLKTAFGFITMLSYITSFEDTVSKHVILCWSFPLWLGLAILVDISVAGSIYLILRKGHPFKSMRLSLLVTRLTKFCIQTGLITRHLLEILKRLINQEILKWIVAQLDPQHFFMCFPLGGIYATCLMAKLVLCY
ncbi:hypothetical protein OG21DRAFT_1519989 [Imleria badia]|nr:hypothetical protein OG21DRAFT_1519989 [Imleria badia]